MQTIEQEYLVEWKPDLTPEAEAHLARLHSEIEPLVAQAALMRRIRKSLGMSQAELAEALQVTQSNVSKMELKDDPPLSVIAGMVKARGGKLRIEIETAEGDELKFAVAG